MKKGKEDGETSKDMRKRGEDGRRGKRNRDRHNVVST